MPPISSHNDVLEALVEGLEVPKTMYEKAEARYTSVGEWLTRDQSVVRNLAPEVSPQGSFLLGTAIKPIAADGHYDIDLVINCTACSTGSFVMKDFKELVGKEVKSYTKANNFNKEPEDNRRCWTLHYADGEQFHLDVLPAVPAAQRFTDHLIREGHGTFTTNNDLMQYAIAITDQKHDGYEKPCDDWPLSNPKGYAEWFKGRQVVMVKNQAQKLFEDRAYSSIEEIPTYALKTPLQRAIQLLKRHRDFYFQGKDRREVKPISMIITTLAALSYNGEESIADALKTIITGLIMGDHIKGRNGVKWIENPVNPTENFADKWENNPAKETAFWEWVNLLSRDFMVYLRENAYTDVPKTLNDAMGHAASKIKDGSIFTGTVTATTATTAAAAAAAEKSGVQAAGTTSKPYLEI